MTERDALELHHPVNGPTADAAAKAVPQVLGGRDDEARGFIRVKGAAPCQVLARLLELDACALNQALHCNFFF